MLVRAVSVARWSLKLDSGIFTCRREARVHVDNLFLSSAVRGERRGGRAVIAGVKVRSRRGFAKMGEGTENL